MSACIVGTMAVRDEAPWAKHLQGFAETLSQHEGAMLLRAGTPLASAAAADGERVVVARFADMAALRRWFDSAEYQSLIPLRDAVADVVLTAYQD